MNFRNKKNAPLEISLTPMIDVVFLLLIFFMVTTTFSKETAIKIQLPQAQGQEAEKHTEGQVLTLTIDKTGQYFINEKALKDRSKETLVQELTALSSNKNTPLIINADASAPVQSAITVLDVASTIGFKAITFATEKE